MTEEINLKEMPNEEILELMHEDLYDGLAEEIVEEVNELLSRDLGPYEVLTKGLVAGMDIVGIDFRSSRIVSRYAGSMLIRGSISSW